MTSAKAFEERLEAETREFNRVVIEWAYNQADGAGFANLLMDHWSEAADWAESPSETLTRTGIRPDVVGRAANGQWWMGRNDGAGLSNVLVGQWAGSIAGGDFVWSPARDDEGSVAAETPFEEPDGPRDQRQSKASDLALAIAFAELADDDLPQYEGLSASSSQPPTAA